MRRLVAPYGSKVIFRIIAGSGQGKGLGGGASATPYSVTCQSPTSTPVARSTQGGSFASKGIGAGPPLRHLTANGTANPCASRSDATMTAVAQEVRFSIAISLVSKL